MQGDICVVCGGDGRISNAWGRTTACPSCQGSGRRVEDHGFHDVTKTKPSHHLPANKPGEPAARKDWPATLTGDKLACEVRDSAHCEEGLKTKLIREIVAYEQSHGQCTLTFQRKVRKQIRAPLPT